MIARLELQHGQGRSATWQGVHEALELEQAAPRSAAEHLLLAMPKRTP